MLCSVTRDCHQQPCWYIVLSFGTLFSLPAATTADGATEALVVTLCLDVNFNAALTLPLIDKTSL
jgi:hypothetical protein